MRLADTADFWLAILIIERVALGLRVGRPGVHRERQADGGILVAVGKTRRGVGALHRIDQRHQRCGGTGTSASASAEAQQARREG